MGITSLILEGGSDLIHSFLSLGLIDEFYLYTSMNTNSDLNVKNPFIKFKNKIDLLCVTSKYDGTPNVLGEALSYGIPCLAPQKVGLSNLLLQNEKYGYLYDPEKPETFCSKVLRIKLEYPIALKKSKLGFFSMKRFDKKNTLYKLKNAIEKI